MKRDYGLAGESTRLAIENGLASAEWYHSEIPRARMKELMQRSDGPAMRDTLLWLSLLAASLAGAIYFWAAGGACRSSSSTERSMAPPAMRAGMKWATVRRSRRNG